MFTQNILVKQYFKTDIIYQTTLNNLVTKIKLKTSYMISYIMG